MTDSDTQTWKPIPGFSRRYEASEDTGHIRSHITGQAMKTRPNNRGYLIVNLTDDNGQRQTRTVHTLILETFAGPCPPGMEACHGPGGQTDNRLANLRWDTKEANRDDWRRDNPPRPKPPKVCVRCGDEFDAQGRRCPPCIQWFAREGARRMAGGEDPEAAAGDLEYPSPLGLIRLARKHAGLRFITEDELNAMLRAAAHPEITQRHWLRRVTRRAEGRTRPW